MSRKHKTKVSAITVEPKEPPKKTQVVIDWEDYFGNGDLGDWQRLMRDLGFKGDFPSKKKCCKVLKQVWVNISDFLNAVANKQPIEFFSSQLELSEYTKKTRKIFPKDHIPKGSPLRRLLAQIRHPETQERITTRSQIDGLRNKMEAFRI